VGKIIIFQWAGKNQAGGALKCNNTERFVKKWWKDTHYLWISGSINIFENNFEMSVKYFLQSMLSANIVTVYVVTNNNRLPYTTRW